MGQAQQELNSFGDAAVYGDKNQARVFSYFFTINDLRPDSKVP